MAGRISISTVVYSKAFIAKTWAIRAELEEYERRGFFQFLYITACGHVESIISDYLKAILLWPQINIRKMSDAGFPTREMTTDGITLNISTEYEQLAINRLIEKTKEDIDKAPFEKLMLLHQTIVGLPLKKIVGDDLFVHLRGLVSVRNLLAHGRQLYIDLDDFLLPDVGFEQHPLENAIKSLRQVNLFEGDHFRSAQPDDVKSVIYKDEVVIHFWNASAAIAEIYNSRAEQENISILGGFNYAIPKLYV